MGINNLIQSNPEIVLSDNLRTMENNQLSHDETYRIFNDIVLPCLVKVDALIQTHSIGRLEKILKISKIEIKKAVKMAEKAHLQAVPSKQHKKESTNEIIYSDWREGYKDIPGYTLDKKGQLCRIHMKYNPSTQDHEPVNILLANFMARIAKEIIRDDGQESKRMFEIDGFLANGRPLPAVTIKAEQFYSMNWVLDSWGAGAIFSPNNGSEKYLRHAMQVFSENKSTLQTIYCHTGWRKINNKWVYLHSSGAIGTNEDIAVDITEGNLEQYTLPLIGNTERSAEMALKILGIADYKIIIPLFALSYLAPLCEPLRRAGKEPAFVMWLSGMSQSMKSSLAGVFLSHFGEDFTEKNLPASFKDSSTSLNRKGFLLKDSLLVVDDFHPTTSKNEAQKMHALAQEIMRTWGDRQGKGRGNVDGTIRSPILPRGLCLVSGEDLPEVGQSGTARFFAVGIKHGDVDKQKLSEIQSNTHLLAQNMANYINWLGPQLDDISNSARGELNGFRDIFNSQGFTGRMPDSIAWLYYGWCKAIQYFESVGVVSADQRDGFIETGLNVLLELATDHSRTIQEERPALKFITALNEMITAEQVDIIPIQDSPREGSNFIGWRDLDYYYLLPDVTFSALVQFFDKQKILFPVSKKTLWKHLLNEGYIEPDNSDTPARQKRINGKNTRLIWLKISCMKGEGK